MKKLTILLFLILISFNSYGEWTEFIKGDDGTTHYIDKHSIKKHGGHVYWWEMKSLSKPTTKTHSAKTYVQGDCGVNRYKALSWVFYEQPMGRGSGEKDNTPSEWSYPLPGLNVGGVMLNYVCDYVK
jgi:hypothetical protein